VNLETGKIVAVGTITVSALFAVNNHGIRCVPLLKPREAGMQELTKEEVRGLGHAVGLEIQDPELTEVTYSLNALLEDLDHINPPGLETVEPLPILLPPS
jgi:hypothetical protein